MIGQTISRYRILSKLGEGGMGIVYMAEDTRLGRTVALKLLPQNDGESRERFLREAQAAASLNHPNLCTIFEIDEELCIIAMELVDGPSLKDKIAARPLPLDEALDIAIQTCLGLQAAHEKGIVHRDIKPANIMLTARGQVKVMDFGLAQIHDRTRLTRPGASIGTPAYMSPEQAQGRPTDRRTDIWSTGVVLYEMLAGLVPFPGQTEAACAYSIVHVEPQPLTALRSGLHLDIDRIVAKALKKDPRDRYQHAEDLMVDLRSLSKQPPSSARIPVSAGINKRRWYRIAPAAAAVLALAAAGYAYFHRIPTPTEKATIVLADLDNTTGDPAFDRSLRRVLAGELGRSPDLTVLSDARMSETLRLMLRAPDTKLTPAVASEICERTLSDAVLEGSIALVGSQYVLSVRARNCRTGDVLDQQQASARKEDVLNALGQVADHFRARAGKSIPRVQKEPSLRADVTTSSLEAWRSFSAAMRAVQTRAVGAETRSLLRRAVEIDPEFAMAHARLGFQEPEAASQNILKAYALRDRVSDWENYCITFIYNLQVTGNLELARQALESWAQKYPTDLHGYLSGITSQGIGRFENAVEQGNRAIGLDPDFAIGYVNTAWAYVYQNRLDEAEAVLRKAAERRIDVIHLSLCRYIVAFLRNDSAAMEKEIAHRNAKFQALGHFEHQEALTLARQGRLKEADSLSDRAITLARHGRRLEQAATFQGAQAVWNALFGFREQARTNAEEALSLSQGRDSSYGPAFAMALLHESAEARKIEADLEKRFPEDTSVQFSYLPALGALEALHQGGPAKALEITRAAAPYELAVPRIAYYSKAFFGALYPVYVRGLAYSKMGRHREAAAEFQKILDHPGLVASDPIAPIARLELARALSASGDRAKSAAAYKDLLAIWKDADPDVPAVQQAKAEFAKHQ